MVLTEYDCSRSTAIQRIAFNKKLNDLIVMFRGDEAKHVYVYSNISAEITNIERILASNHSKGEFVNEIKSKSEFRIIKRFPSNVQMYQYTSQQPGCNSARNTNTDTGMSQAKTVRNKKTVPGEPEGLKQKQKLKQQQKQKQQQPPIAKAPRQKKKFKNYTNLWLDILANHTVNNREYLESLLPVLDKCHPNYPPARKPPRLRSGGDAPSSTTEEVEEEDGYSAIANAFSALSVDAFSDEEDEKESDDDEEEVVNDSPDEVKEVQSRYLIVHVVCSIAEIYRNEALSAQREKDYGQVRLKWLTAWERLTTCQENIDAWCAILFSQSDQPFAVSAPSHVVPSLPKQHNRAQLVDLFQALHILIQDTERQKDQALAQLHKRIQYINSKLNPLLQDRNVVKASMGDDKWVNNPEPKQTYAEKRKQWEEDLKHLTEAALLMESLDFHVIYNSR